MISACARECRSDALCKKEMLYADFMLEPSVDPETGEISSTHSSYEAILDDAALR